MLEFISNFLELEFLNVSVNKFSVFLFVGNLKFFYIFNVVYNSLIELLEGIFNFKFVYFSQIIVGNNEIELLFLNVTELLYLNMLDMFNNKLKEVFVELSECFKFKEFNLKGNKFLDRRFGKLVE